jgi:septum formation inhibitor MinC
MAKSSSGKGSSGSNSSGGGSRGGWSDDSEVGGDVGINLGADLRGSDLGGGGFCEGPGSLVDTSTENERSGLFSGVALGAESADEAGVIDVASLAGDSTAGDSGDSSRGGIVAARGTVDGLVIRVDGRVESATLRQALDEFVSARSSFLAGQEVFLEWVGMRPALEVEESLTHLLKRSYGIVVKSVRLYTRPRTSDAGLDTSGRSSSDRGGMSVRGGDGSSLFEGARVIGARVSDAAAGGSFREVSRDGGRGKYSTSSKDSGMSSSSNALPSFSGRAGRTVNSRSPHFQSPLSGSSIPWDEPDTRLIHANLRSGQKIESEHSLVIVGDVNSGAEVISGGDVVILGSLRGVAHAGAYEESGGGRVIFAINMQPTQLRIGSVISRGSAQDAKGIAPEVARVDGNLIVVEQYHTKTLGGTLAGSMMGGIGSSIVGLLGRKRGSVK